MSDRGEETTKALIAVDALVGTLAMAIALVDDETAAEALRTALAGAVTARTLLEQAVEGDPVKEPQKDAYATMGQPEEEGAEEGAPPTDPPCEHEHILAWAETPGEPAGAMCRDCGEAGQWLTS